MRSSFIQNALMTALLTTLALPALAHDGRRYEVKVVDSQLVAHGYVSGGQPDDGAGVIRPYYNTIHGHFSNKTANFATADLPGFDILDEADELIGYELRWVSTGFAKWSTPNTTGPVSLQGLDGDEVIEVVYGGDSVRSDQTFVQPFSFQLLSNYNGSNGDDLDFSYDFYGDNPSGELYVIQSVLTTDAPGIADSTTIYTILSPDGATPMEKLHHASLFTEQSLGTPIPEPGMLSLAVLFPILMRRRTANARVAR